MRRCRHCSELGDGLPHAASLPPHGAARERSSHQTAHILGHPGAIGTNGPVHAQVARKLGMFALLLTQCIHTTSEPSMQELAATVAAQSSQISALVATVTHRLRTFQNSRRDRQPPLVQPQPRLARGAASPRPRPRSARSGTATPCMPSTIQPAAASTASFTRPSPP